MKFMIQSIDTRVETLPNGGSRAVYVFNFLQLNIRMIHDTTTTEVILMMNDPLAQEWLKAFHEGKEFKFSINPN